MTIRLGSSELKSGGRAEIAVIDAPDPGDPLQVRPLLGHKGEPWLSHIRESLDRPLDALETRFYVAIVEDRAVSNVMTVEHRGVGILGHVFTLPEHRRRGLCTAIFERLIPHFVQRDGLRLTLGTGYGSAPYQLYHRFGFRGVVPETGFMKWSPVDDFAARWYALGEVRIVDLDWRHWPTAAQLFADDFGDGLQFYQTGRFGPFNFEGPFLKLSESIRAGQGPAVKLLETEQGAVVGWAALRPDPAWEWPSHVLDLVIHPNFTRHLPPLLQALPWPAGKVLAYLPSPAAARRDALLEFGFQREGTLREQLRDGADVQVYGCC